MTMGPLPAPALKAKAEHSAGSSWAGVRCCPPWSPSPERHLLPNTDDMEWEVAVSCCPWSPGVGT